jgi:hypothetical protein
MKRVLIASAVMLCITVPAMAQTAGSASTATVTNSSQSGSAANVYGNPIGNGASSSISGATAGSLSRSNSSAQSGVATARTGSSSARTGSSSATVSVYTGVSGGSGSDPSGDPSGSSGGGDPTINYTGGYTVRNTPEVIAPSIIGGNPCSVGVSAGVAVAGFGLTGGGTWADRACERRQEAALLYNIGQQQAAVALLCQDEHVRDAMYSVGRACQAAPRPVAVAAPPAGAVAVAAPVPQPVARPVATAAYAPPARPDWCDTVSGAREQARFRAQCRWFPTAAAQAQPYYKSGRVAWNDR